MTIKDDQTFEYFETGCLSQSFSNGIWEINNDTLTLNSSIPNECFYKDDFSLNEENLEDLQTTLKDCEPKENTEFFTEFKNSTFIVTQDSLIYQDLETGYFREYGNYKIF